MSQHDLTIDNQGFPAFRSDLNNALQALGSNSSGTSAPSTTFANQLWYDTTNDILKIRNADNDAWIAVASFNQTTDAISYTSMDIDNVNIDGNTISSSDTNGDLNLTPNGTGDLALDGTNWPQTAGTANYALFTDGTDQASWETLGWELLETQTVSGAPTSLDFTTGFNSKYTKYACEINGIGGSDASYGIWNVSSDGLTSVGTADYGRMISGFSHTSSSDIYVSTGAGFGTAKRGVIFCEFTGFGGGNRPMIRGSLINTTGTNGSFYGYMPGISSVNGIRYKQAVGTLSGGSGNLYGKR